MPSAGQTDNLGYDELLLNLTEVEVLSRKENGYKKNVRGEISFIETAGDL